MCVVSIPDGETRYIKDRPVFYVTALFSIFAYMWLILILQMNTPNVVDVWEGVVSFMLFPLLVYIAYLADQQVSYCCGKRSPTAPGGHVVAMSKVRHAIELAEIPNPDLDLDPDPGPEPDPGGPRDRAR